VERLNPEKLHVTYLAGTTVGDLVLPRRYTLTHSDITGELFLSIGKQYQLKQISGLYTRLMRDEVLAELSGNGEGPALRVYCHVSGGPVLGTAGWRYSIFCSELHLVLEAFRYGDRTLFDRNRQLNNAPVFIHFQSTHSRFNKVEKWGTMDDYR
jgi:hypothetical protein